MYSFKTKFGNKQVERASRGAFNAVAKQVCKGDNELGAIFCQLQEDHSRLILTGVYLPPEWATKINEVLRAYKDELKKQLKKQKDE